MAKRLTTNDFIFKAKKVHGNVYDYSKTTYVRSISKVIIICSKHGEFEQTPNSHLAGNGCRLCGIEHKASLFSLKQDEFILKASKIHKNKYSYDYVVYKNNSTKVLITCPLHGNWRQAPKSHLNGYGCPICGGSKKRTFSEFVSQANQKHSNKYTYSNFKYINDKTKGLITCSKHGDFKQTPNNHLVGKGCPVCAQISKSSNLPEFLVKSNKVHKNKYDYSLFNYTNNRNKSTIICPTHGEFEQTPSSHLSGSGCPGCSIKGFDQTKPGILYYLKIIADSGLIVYKIGITNKSVKERFNLIDLAKIEIVKLTKYDIGLYAFQEEQRILKEYSQYKYHGPAILESGNTELFTKNVLDI